MKTVKFYTLGCKVNQYDTQLIREQFAAAGFKELNNGSPAEVCVINTCTVTHRADADSFNIIRRMSRENPAAKIIVTGCLAERDADKIKAVKARALVLKNIDKENIIRHIGQATDSVKNTISYFAGHSRAFIKIQDGCDNFCSYCKVPLVRGHSRSRDIEEIAREASNLAANGFREIVLCGICLGSYGREIKPKKDIVEVIERLENIPGILRIRLSSIEARDITQRLIAKLSSSKILCRHLHIPLQSGDDSILKKMNRQYSGRDYLNLIRRIRKRVPQIAITTDVMTGFPGESQENFQNTVRLVKRILALKVHIFSYSARPGTAAYLKFRQGLDPKIIKQRRDALKRAAQDSSAGYKKFFLKQVMLVLAEDKTESGLWQGYTGNYIRVLFRSGRRIQNTLVRVRLKKIVKDDVLAEEV